MAAQNPPPIVLVDGSSYLYRAFHAMYKADLRNDAGFPTGAIRTVTSMMRSLQGQYPSSPIAVIFDAKGKTFRDDMYTEYKAQRPPMPDDLRLQVEPVHSIIEAMGFPIFTIDGVEADDVIGTFALQGDKAGLDIVVSTGDKDLAQLVTPHVTLINTMTDTTMDIEGVKEKFGIGPELIIDYLALVGDKVDNIPGVPGVGEKTALAMLTGVGSIDTIYSNLDKLATLTFRGAKTIAKKMQDNEAMARLSYELATIKCDVSLDQDVTQLANRPQDNARLFAMFKEYGFNSWLGELENSDAEATEVPSVEAVETDYVTLFDEADVAVWLENIAKKKCVAVDTETTSLNYMAAELVGVSLAFEAGKACYIPCAHQYLDCPEQIDRDRLLTLLKPMLENPDIQLVGQNIKYDMHIFANYGIHLQGVAFDTMLESYVLNATGSKHDMDTLATKYLNQQTVKFEDIAGKGKKQLTFDQIDIDTAGHYAAEDADITWRLHEVIGAKLAETPSLETVYNTLEKPLIEVIQKIEYNGAFVDVNELGKQSIAHGEQIDALEKQAHEMAGEPFNLSSPKQLGVILFEKLALPVIKKTPKGAPSTAEEVLQELALDYPLPQVLMRYRTLTKLKSTYTDKLPLMVNPKTQRIHTSYHQAVTATGRLSSSDPNLQNIPIRTEEGRNIRKAFVAPKGTKIVAADYSQIELRIMAHLSKDKGLLTAFNEGLDVHKATAAEVFDVAIDEVTGDMRRSAKAINFGLIYGMSAFGLAKQLRIARNDAQHYIDMYFERYPGVADYMAQAKVFAKEHGYVETLLGRRLYLPEINASNKMRQQAAERVAINAPMQGTAADIIKLAMIHVQDWIEAEYPQAKMIMQVHDELVCEVPHAQAEAFAKGLEAVMSNAVELDIPLLVESGVGDNWEQAH